MFGRHERMQPSHMSIEEQLERLAECGLEPLRPAAITSWLEEFGREALEGNPFDLILSCLAGDYEDAHGQWRPSSAGVWYLDTECIYSADDYIRAVERLITLTRGELRIENLEARFEDAEAWVRFNLDGTSHHWDLEVSDDWIDTTLIDRFAGLLAERRSERRYCVEQTSGQDCLIICPTRDEFRRLSEVSPRPFEQLGPAW